MKENQNFKPGEREIRSEFTANQALSNTTQSQPNQNNWTVPSKRQHVKDRNLIARLFNIK